MKEVYVVNLNNKAYRAFETYEDALTFKKYLKSAGMTSIQSVELMDSEELKIRMEEA